MATSVLERLVIQLEADVSRLRSELGQAERTAEQSASRIGRSLGNITTGLRNLGGSVGGLIGAGSITFALRQASNEAANAEVTFRLFERQLNRSGQAIGASVSRIEGLADRLGVIPSTLQEGTTQLLRQGLTVDQIAAVFEGAAASALAAGKTTQQGIEAVSQAIVNQNSIFLNQAGISENLITAYRDLARQTGRSTEELTKQERAQAAVNLVLKATREEVADLDTLLGGLRGEQNRIARESAQFRQELGALVNEAFIPLVRVGANALEAFNNLPGPMRRAATAFTAAAGAATVAGTAIGVLALALGPLIGPVGLLVLAAGAAGALAVAFLDIQNQADPAAAAMVGLQDTADNAFETLASSRDSVDELVGSLDSLGESLEGPAKTAWEGYAEQVRATKGDIDDAKAAAADAARAFARTQFIGLTGAVATAAQAGGALSDANRRGVQQGLLGAIREDDPVAAIDTLQGLAADLIAAGQQEAASVVISAIAAAQTWEAAGRRVEAAAERQEGAADDGGGGGGTRRTGRTREPRTSAQVFAELTAAGQGSQERAFALIAAGADPITTELASLNERLAAVRQAFAELTGGEVIGIEEGEIAFLAGRIQELEGAIEGLEALGAPINVQPRQAAGGAVRAGFVAGAVPGALEPSTFGAVESGLFPNLGDPSTPINVTRSQSEINAEADAFANALSPIGIGPRPRGFIPAPRVPGAPEAPLPGTRLDVGIPRNITADPLLGQALAPGAGDLVLGKLGDIEDAINESIGPTRFERVTPQTEGIIPAIREPGIPLDNELSGLVDPNTGQVVAFNRELGAVLPVEPGGVSLSLPVFGPGGERIGAGDDIRFSPIGPRPTEPAPIGFQGDVSTPEELQKAAEEAAEKQREAAETFRSTIVQSGLQFANTVVRGIQTGDVGSIVGGAISFAGSFAQFIPGVGPALAQLLQGGAGILGGLFGGGDRDRRSRAARDAERARTPPALEVNVTFNQENEFNTGITDPVTQTALRGQFDAFIQAWEDSRGFREIHERVLGGGLES